MFKVLKPHFTQNALQLRLRSDLFVMHTHKICPPLLTHPGRHLLTHTCTDSQRQMPYTGAVGSQSQRLGSMGVRCLAQGHLSRDKEVNCQVQVPIFVR